MLSVFCWDAADRSKSTVSSQSLPGSGVSPQVEFQTILDCPNNALLYGLYVCLWGWLQVCLKSCNLSRNRRTRRGSIIFFCITFSSAVGRWKLENITTTDEPSQESTNFWAENKILFVRVWIVSCCWQLPAWHDTSWGLSTSDSYGGAQRTGQSWTVCLKLTQGSKKKVVKICLARALERRSHVTWDYLFPRKFDKTKCCKFALFDGVIVWKHIKCLVLKGFWFIGRKYFFQILTVQIKTKNSIKIFKWAKQIEKLHAFINFTLFNFPSDYNRIILWPKKSFYVIESHIGSIQFLLHHFTIEKHITDLLKKKK